MEPRWRAAKVGDIRHTGVRAWAAELSKGLSASWVITVYSVLAGILAALIVLASLRFSKKLG